MTHEAFARDPNPQPLSERVEIAMGEIGVGACASGMFTWACVGVIGTWRLMGGHDIFPRDLADTSFLVGRLYIIMGFMYIGVSSILYRYNNQTGNCSDS